MSKQQQTQQEIVSAYVGEWFEREKRRRKANAAASKIAGRFRGWRVVKRHKPLIGQTSFVEGQDRCE